MSDPRTEGETAAKARRGRNVALGLALAAFVVIIFIVTIVRLGANAAAPF